MSDRNTFNHVLQGINIAVLCVATGVGSWYLYQSNKASSFQNQMLCDDNIVSLDSHLSTFSIAEDNDGELLLDYFVEEGDTARKVAWLFNNLDTDNRFEEVTYTDILSRDKTPVGNYIEVGQQVYVRTKLIPPIQKDTTLK